MKNLCLVALVAMMVLVGCGSEPVKSATLSPEGKETILEENIITENIIEETWDSPNVKRWD